MKVSSLVTSLFTSSVVLASSIEDTAVFQFNSVADAERVPIVNNQEALLYLSDKFDVSDFYGLGNEADKSYQETIDFISRQYNKIKDQAFNKPRVVAVVNGLESPQSFFSKNQLNPSFKISNTGDENLSLIHQVFNRFPKFFASLNSKDVQLNSLTNEMKFVSSASAAPSAKLLATDNETEKDLIHHFKFFNAKLATIWKNFQTQFAFNHEQTSNEEIRNPSTLKLINDRLFINDLSQLVHLKEHKLADAENDLLFLKLDSLVSLGNKIGIDSQTFQFSSQVLADYFVELSEDYDITVIAIPSSKELTGKYIDSLNKRSKEIDSFMKKTTSGSGLASSGVSCFSTEEDCQASTSNCNSHGACSKVSSKCWSCLCSPTFDEKKQKTTRWTGFDCHKKEISSEANLLLWTTILLIVLIAGGIKLLVSVGSDPLPGVLDAATTAKKST